MLLTSEPRDLEFFKAAAAYAQIPCQQVCTPVDVCNELLRDPAALVIVNADSAKDWR